MVAAPPPLLALEGLLRQVTYLSADGQALVEQAYVFAAQAHAGQRRLSGEPFIQHPLHTARRVAELQMDAISIAAALLHDVVEDCGVELEAIEGRFGAEARRLVDGVTKLSRLIWPTEDAHRRGPQDRTWLESLRKMFVAMAEDLRVVVIKLADRLHNMETLHALPEEAKRRAIAQETRDIYAPLASRLGIGQFAGPLEDLAFLHLEPERYQEVARLVASQQEQQESYLKRIGAALEGELRRASLSGEVSGRAKHLFSIWQKMERYAAQGKGFADIYDLLAVRVLVPTEAECYAALGVIHQLWPPVPGQFDDYIARPKNDLYQSLHTTVVALDGQPLEIQIRTPAMHLVAEYGVAAHWAYKEGGRAESLYEQRLAWLRQLMEWHRELAGAEQFVESVRTDIFADQVFVYTPRGDIRELPVGSTPIDFAYRIHTELGHRCIGAKASGRLVPLNYRLQNGDVVEILAAKSERGPSRDWLNSHLGYVVTSTARNKIRQWFHRLERTENIAQGKAMLERELRRQGLPFAHISEVARAFKFEDTEDLYHAIGCGEVTVQQVTRHLLPPELPVTAPAAPRRVAQGVPGTQVLGVGDLLMRLAQCCLPVPGEPIVGYITRGRGVTVHRQDCPNVAHSAEEERMTPVAWSTAQVHYQVPLRIRARDRVGLLRDITTLIAAEGVNLASAVTRVHTDGTTVITATLEVTGLEQLNRIMARLDGVRSVVEVSRQVSRPRDNAQ